jgi:serine/threonine protein kinase
MNFLQLVGETLDGKYKIERELGKGGMGTVYFATHLGTERPVAVKVIVPQFMQKAEFVERFRREARAAGRLRHPNVVDVTDFGISESKDGKVAYLVMEYLDGCTLGEILEEEKQLPLSFTLDILEQVCFAVQEAHEQGIIHRDLKPDNIWLEPNQRGGYTVKVLDFGIAKLEEAGSFDSQNVKLRNALPTQSFQQSETVADQTHAKTIIENQNSTMISESNTAIFHESGTLVQTVESEQGTAILDVGEQNTAILSDKQTRILADEGGTKMLSVAEDTDNSAPNSTAELTRVGAVLGTPLYMSPEQCRGEKLTSRSDIYSLAVIAYQMLGGKTPFAGEFMSVMESHKADEPEPLDAKKVPKKVKQVIHSALSKNVDERPPTAEAFASELRSHSEGFGKLLQRALVIYSEHLPKFLGLGLLATLPNLILAILQVSFGILASTEVIEVDTLKYFIGTVSFIGFFAQIFTAALIIGTVTWLVARILAAPLRPISVKSGLKMAWTKRKPLFLTLIPQTLLTLITVTCCFPLGIYFSTIYSLITPSIMMENVSGKAAFRRSKELVNRSFWTTLAVSILIYMVPVTIGGTIGIVTAAITRQAELNEKAEKVKTSVNKVINEANDDEDNNDEDNNVEDNNNNTDINIGNGVIKIKDSESDNLSPEEKYAKRLKNVRRETLTQFLMHIFLTPILILISSLSFVITALLYIKTRLAGGESMQDLLSKFEDADSRKTTKWQTRIRERLQQSGRVTGKT